jgi:hypothetical protein
MQTNLDSGLFGLVNFRINQVLQNAPGGGSEIPACSQVKVMNEIDSVEATTEVISHTEGLEALEHALLYVGQHSKATPIDVIFVKYWRDIAASSHHSTLYQNKITDFVKKGQFINV